MRHLQSGNGEIVVSPRAVGDIVGSSEIVQFIFTPKQTAGFSTPGKGNFAARPTIAGTKPNKIKRIRSSNL